MSGPGFSASSPEPLLRVLKPEHCSFLTRAQVPATSAHALCGVGPAGGSRAEVRRRAGVFVSLLVVKSSSSLAQRTVPTDCFFNIIFDVRHQVSFRCATQRLLTYLPYEVISAVGLSIGYCDVTPRGLFITRSLSSKLWLMRPHHTHLFSFCHRKNYHI